MTAARQKVLREIRKRQGVARTGPTLKQIAKALDVNVFAIQRHVGKLREEGALLEENGHGLVVADQKPTLEAAMQDASEYIARMKR